MPLRRRDVVVEAVVYDRKAHKHVGHVSLSLRRVAHDSAREADVLSLVDEGAHVAERADSDMVQDEKALDHKDGGRDDLDRELRAVAIA